MFEQICNVKLLFEDFAYLSMSKRHWPSFSSLFSESSETKLMTKFEG